jgi:hypothetical protein
LDRDGFIEQDPGEGLFLIDSNLRGGIAGGDRWLLHRSQEKPADGVAFIGQSTRLKLLLYRKVAIEFQPNRQRC